MSEFSSVTKFLEEDAKVEPVGNEFDVRPEVTAETEQEGRDFDFLDAADTAMELDGLVGSIQRVAYESSFKLDKDYNLEDLDTLMEGVPDNRKPIVRRNLTSARNQEHAAYIRQRTLDELDMEEKLASYGGAGLATRIAVNITDPVAMALAVTPLGGIQKGSKIATMFKVGGAAAVENAALEYAVMSGSKTRTLEDVAWAAATGGVLGGGIGAVIGGRGVKTGPARNTPADNMNKDIADASSASTKRLMEVKERQLTKGTKLAPLPEHLKVARADIEAEEIAYSNFQAVRRQEAGIKDPSAQPKQLTPAEKAHAENVQRITARTAENQTRIDMIRNTDFPAPTKARLGKLIDEAQAALNELDAAAKPSQKLDQNVGTAKRRLLAEIEETGDADLIADMRNSFAGINPKLADFRSFFSRNADGIKAKLDAAHDKLNTQWIAKLDSADEQIAKLKAEQTKLQQELAVSNKALEDLEDLSAGASHVGETADDLLPTGELADLQEELVQTFPLPKWANLRWGMSGQLGKSINARARMMGEWLMENAVGTADGSVSHSSASEISEWITDVSISNFQRAAMKAMPDWGKAHGYNRWDLTRPNVREEYMNEIGRAVRDGSGASEVMEAANAARKSFAFVAEQAKKGKVRGFPDDFETGGNYLPRIIDNETVDHWSKWMSYKPGKGMMPTPAEELVRRGLIKAQPDIDPKLSQTIARAYIRNARVRHAGAGGTLPDLNVEDLDQLADTLRGMELDEDSISDVMHMMARRDDPKQAKLGPARSKKRLLMDLDVSLANVTNQQTGIQGATLHLEDLFDHNVERLVSSYSRGIGGLAAIAQRSKGTAYHIRSKSDFKEYLQHMLREEESLDPRGLRGLNPMSNSVLHEKDILERGWKNLVGEPINDPRSFGTQLQRSISQFNFAADMGNVVTAQLGEWGAAISAGSVRTLLKSMPSLGRLLKSLPNQRAASELAETMEVMSGLGTNRLRGSATTKGLDPEISGNAGVGASGINDTLHKMGQITGNTMARLIEVQHRGTSMNMVHDFVHGAFGGSMKASQKRLNSIGLSASKVKAIQKQLIKHGVDKDGNPIKKGSTVSQPHFDKWDDLDLRDTFMHAIRRKSRRSIQEVDFGQMHQWQTTVPGKLFFEFRRFVLAAHPKQLLYNLNMHDIEAAQYLALSMMTVFAGNYARLQVAHWGKENYDELMEKALDPVEFSKSSASRAAWASIWPSVIDMVGTPFNEGENVISPFRSSGLESYGPESIPTGRRVGSAGRLLSGGIQMSMNALGLQDGDYEFSQKNWRDVKALLPFNTMPVIGNGINAIGNALDLPKESKKR